MRIVSYIMLIFALLTQGAVARALPITITDIAPSEHHIMAVTTCHQTDDIKSPALSMAAHDCCDDHHDQATHCQAMADPACSDGCAQCQSHHTSFAQLLLSEFLAPPLLSEPVRSQIIALNSRIISVPTPPPSA